MSPWSGSVRTRPSRPPHRRVRSATGPAEDNDAKLTDWITTVRATDVPHLHSFANGLELDRAAVDAGLMLPYHNGRTEGVNTRPSGS
ncbi:hypothetical protein AQJ67_41670 [Streptomyces caeruleatus]|uniref:Transposase IS204/IS1001/IS1096/IS1165 DDE domain-containing protein n=1 Tax=Streptomyces caeruleatus TaxID=661399 RepID=A0A117RHV0_9ACTN|nr:hypothetical protein AQJ67_41670 [Streptomyces caeruleatus]